jgi:hypothetical protein
MLGVKIIHNFNEFDISGIIVVSFKIKGKGRRTNVNQNTKKSRWCGLFRFSLENK